MTKLYSIGFGVGTQNRNDEWLEVYYPLPILHPTTELGEILTRFAGSESGNRNVDLDADSLTTLAEDLSTGDHGKLAAVVENLRPSVRPVVLTILEKDEAPSSVPEAYLKLHLISHRLVKPHDTNLTGIFGALPNVAWTNRGAVDLAELPQRQMEARVSGDVLEVNCVDKFPRMTDYVVPKGVRIADTARVRLGAYLGEGTTIMHEGFVNFNAGCEGPNMVEGRISAGVFVSAGSDLGGGCSTMGTLSGGGNIIISIGRECLLGANAGVGIPLGDRCTIEAGLYLTGGTKVRVLDDQKQFVEEVKARDLAGKPNLLFRRNSTTGAVECLTNKTAIELNESLHAHN